MNCCRTDQIQYCFKFGAQWRADGNIPPAQRQTQTVSMQKQPTQPIIFHHPPVECSIAVLIIASQRIAGMRGMDANLMGASGRNPGFQERSGCMQADRLEPGKSRFAIIQHLDHAFSTAQHIAPQGLVDFTRAVVPIATHQRQVAFLHPSSPKRFLNLPQRRRRVPRDRPR